MARAPDTPTLTVREAMDPDPVRLGPDRPVREAVAAMDARRAGCVLVTDPGRGLVGIFTERDLIRRVAAAGPGWRDRPIAEWMTPAPETVAASAGWDEALERMARFRVRRLPVVDSGEVVGIVSTRLLMAKREAYLSGRVRERTAELNAANEQLMARDAEVLFNLRAAGRIQTRALLPQAAPDWPELRWAISYLPLDQLGGDYYDFAEPAPGKLGFLIADASGHSIPAAFVAVMARFAFAAAAATCPDPGAVLGSMNRRLAALTDERFVTAFYGVIDRATGVLKYAAAGHPPPLLWRDAAVRGLSAQGFILGVVPDEVYAEREVTMRPGDKVVFYTDGVTEARNEIGEMFGAARLEDAVRAAGAGDAAAILSEVVRRLHAFRDRTPYTDDVTIAVVELLAGPAA